jgi:hypothetical protein
MKKQMVVVVIGLLSVFLIFGSSLAWQGRMAGMGDPYGLVHDESDMLIHPAMIMNSSGTRFYTHYRFTYTDVMDWDYKWDFSNGTTEFFKASGDEYKHETLIGSAFKLGSGRMGIFFTFENQSGDYDGEIDPHSLGPDEKEFGLESDKSDFALSLLFGFPIDCIYLGFEAGLAYHNEENEVFQEYAGYESTNFLYYIILYPNTWSNIYTYMIPYDSKYYETFMKASVASELGCNADFGLTLNGGYIFSGDNEFNSEDDNFPELDFEMDGEIEGWSIGGDFWFRYKVDKSLSLPFLVSAGYQEKIKDGEDNVIFGGIPREFEYEHKEIKWNIEAGGGIDIALDDSSKIASGIYYQYAENNNDFSLVFPTPFTDMDCIPDYDEHRVTLKLAYEKDMSSILGFRAGFNCFYGWADWDYKNYFIVGIRKERVSMDGNLWGIGLVLGGTIKIDPVTFEPFIGAAYQETDLDGDGRVTNGMTIDIEGDHERDQWLVATGLSILF